MAIGTDSTSRSGRVVVYPDVTKNGATSYLAVNGSEPYENARNQPMRAAVIASLGDEGRG